MNRPYLPRPRYVNIVINASIACTFIIGNYPTSVVPGYSCFVIFHCERENMKNFGLIIAIAAALICSNVAHAQYQIDDGVADGNVCLLYTSPSPRDATLSRMPSSA